MHVIRGGGGGLVLELVPLIPNVYRTMQGKEESQLLISLGVYTVLLWRPPVTGGVTHTHTC